MGVYMSLYDWLTILFVAATVAVMVVALDLHGQVDPIFPLLKTPVRCGGVGNHAILRVEGLRCCCQGVHRVHRDWVTMDGDESVALQVGVSCRVIMLLDGVIVLSNCIGCVPYCWLRPIS